jgi:hypothetical protein
MFGKVKHINEHSKLNPSSLILNLDQTKKSLNFLSDEHYENAVKPKFHKLLNMFGKAKRINKCTLL